MRKRLRSGMLNIQDLILNLQNFCHIQYSWLYFIFLFRTQKNLYSQSIALYSFLFSYKVVLITIKEIYSRKLIGDSMNSYNPTYCGQILGQDMKCTPNFSHLVHMSVISLYFIIKNDRKIRFVFYKCLFLGTSKRHRQEYFFLNTIAIFYSKEYICLCCYICSCLLHMFTCTVYVYYCAFITRNS